MAMAVKCDRCGNLREYYAGDEEFKESEKANGIILIDRYSYTQYGYFLRKSYDLCPDCMRKLEAFIKNRDDIGYKE